MRAPLLVALGFIAALGASSPVPAGQALSYYLPSGTTYDPKVPTPEGFFGFQLGEWHLRSDQLVTYCRAVAAAAPRRVKFEIIGRTWEQRPLVQLTVTSADNLKNLEKIRTDHLDLLDPGKAKALDLAALPVVVDLGYGVHGNEPSGANAVPAILYYLAAAKGSAVEDLLARTVILIEPQRNPDGGDWFALWANANRATQSSADPASREHHEGWPGGRTNHYWADSNRDWLTLVHPEARARVELFQRWRPNVLADHHEMQADGTFYFQPGAPSRDNPSIPARTIELTARIAAHHAKAFDAYGALYYSAQDFDDFFPGKGSTYPDLQGGVGLLFEQAGPRGQVLESGNGMLTFPFAIRNQVTATLGTLEAAQALRTELLELQRDFVPEALELARKAKVKAYVFGDAYDPVRAAAMIDVLTRHHIEVRALAEEVTADDVTYRPGEAWAVLAEQPQYRLLTELFVRRTEFTGAVFYDGSAWTLPLGFGLPYAALGRVPATGEALAAAPKPAGRLVGAGRYAYLFDWTGYRAPRALTRLQKAGFDAKVLTEPVEAATAEGAVAFGRGSILVPLGGLSAQRSKELATLVGTIVRDDALTVYAVDTGFTPQGADLGSTSFVALKPPRVALLTGEGVDAIAAGEVWHLFDTRVGMTATLLDLAQANRADWTRYNVVVMVDGVYETLTDAAIVSLRRWVRAGGVLVALGRAAEWAAVRELTRAEFVPPPAVAASAAADADTPSVRRPYADGPADVARGLIRGSILATTVDLSHPLGYGLGSASLAVYRDNRIFMRSSRSAYDTPVVYADRPLLAGYVSTGNLQALAGSAAAIAQPSGTGAVILFTDDPNFRGCWYAGNRLFLNAVFFGQIIKPPAALAVGD